MTTSTKRTLTATAALAGSAALALGSPLAVADESLPTITLSAATGTVKVLGADALTAGPHSFVVKPGPKEKDITIFALKEGASLKELSAAAAKLHGPPTGLQKFGSFIAGPSLAKGQPVTTSLDLAQGEYVVFDTTRAPKVAGTFTVDSPAAQAGFALPKTSATIKLDDFKIDAPASITHGTNVEVVNEGPSPHFLTSAPVKNAADGAKVAADLKAGKEKDAQKLVKGGFYNYVGLLSPKVSNVVSLSNLKPGVYVLACFYADSRSKGKEHSMLGMERVITVR